MTDRITTFCVSVPSGLLGTVLLDLFVGLPIMWSTNIGISIGVALFVTAFRRALP